MEYPDFFDYKNSHSTNFSDYKNYWIQYINLNNSKLIIRCLDNINKLHYITIIRSNQLDIEVNKFIKILDNCLRLILNYNISFELIGNQLNLLLIFDNQIFNKSYLIQLKKTHDINEMIQILKKVENLDKKDCLSLIDIVSKKIDKLEITNNTNEIDTILKIVEKLIGMVYENSIFVIKQLIDNENTFKELLIEALKVLIESNKDDKTLEYTLSIIVESNIKDRKNYLCQIFGNLI